VICFTLAYNIEDYTNVANILPNSNTPFLLELSMAIIDTRNFLIFEDQMMMNKQIVY